MDKIPTFQEKSSNFQFNILLGNQVWTLIFIYNARSESWYLNITDGTYILYGIKLVVDWLLLRQYKALIPNFEGDLLLVKTDDNAEDYLTYENLNDGWELNYVSEDEATEWEVENGFQ